MTLLPGGERCVVDLRKIIDYLLDPTHPSGGSKARYFSRFGFDRAQPEVMRAALRVHATTIPVHSETSNAEGRRIILRCQLATPDGRDPCIRSVWFVTDDGPPRLITAYPG